MSQKLSKYFRFAYDSGPSKSIHPPGQRGGGRPSTLVRSAEHPIDPLTTVDSSQGSVRSFRTLLDNASLACLDRDRSPRSQRRCHYRRLKHHEVQDMTIGEL